MVPTLCSIWLSEQTLPCLPTRTFFFLPPFCLTQRNTSVWALTWQWSWWLIQCCYYSRLSWTQIIRYRNDSPCFIHLIRNLSKQIITSEHRALPKTPTPMSAQHTRGHSKNSQAAKRKRWWLEQNFITEELVKGT